MKASNEKTAAPKPESVTQKKIKWSTKMSQEVKKTHILSIKNPAECLYDKDFLASFLTTDEMVDALFIFPTANGATLMENYIPSLQGNPAEQERFFQLLWGSEGCIPQCITVSTDGSVRRFGITLRIEVVHEASTILGYKYWWDGQLIEGTLVYPEQLSQPLTEADLNYLKTSLIIKRLRDNRHVYPARVTETMCTALIDKPLGTPFWNALLSINTVTMHQIIQFLAEIIYIDENPRNKERFLTNLFAVDATNGKHILYRMSHPILFEEGIQYLCNVYTPVLRFIQDDPDISREFKYRRLPAALIMNELGQEQLLQVPELLSNLTAEDADAVFTRDVRQPFYNFWESDQGVDLFKTFPIGKQIIWAHAYLSSMAEDSAKDATIMYGRYQAMFSCVFLETCLKMIQDDPPLMLSIIPALPADKHLPQAFHRATLIKKRFFLPLNFEKLYDHPQVLGSLTAQDIAALCKGDFMLRMISFWFTTQGMSLFRKLPVKKQNLWINMLHTASTAIDSNDTKPLQVVQQPPAQEDAEIKRLPDSTAPSMPSAEETHVLSSTDPVAPTQPESALQPQPTSQPELEPELEPVPAPVPVPKPDPALETQIAAPTEPTVRIDPPSVEPPADVITIAPPQEKSPKKPKAKGKQRKQLTAIAAPAIAESPQQEAQHSQPTSLDLRDCLDIPWLRSFDTEQALMNALTERYFIGRQRHLGDQAVLEFVPSYFIEQFIRSIRADSSAQKVLLTKLLFNKTNLRLRLRDDERIRERRPADLFLKVAQNQEDIQKTGQTKIAYCYFLGNKRIKGTLLYPAIVSDRALESLDPQFFITHLEQENQLSPTAFVSTMALLTIDPALGRGFLYEMLSINTAPMGDVFITLARAISQRNNTRATDAFIARLTEINEKFPFSILQECMHAPAMRSHLLELIVMFPSLLPILQRYQQAATDLPAAVATTLTTTLVKQLLAFPAGWSILYTYPEVLLRLESAQLNSLLNSEYKGYLCDFFASAPAAAALRRWAHDAHNTSQLLAATAKPDCAPDTTAWGRQQLQFFAESACEKPGQDTHTLSLTGA